MLQDSRIELYATTKPYYDLPVTRENATHLCVSSTRSDSSAGQNLRCGMVQSRGREFAGEKIIFMRRLLIRDRRESRLRNAYPIYAYRQEDLGTLHVP